MISLKDIRKKILSGDISSLLHFGNDSNIHPSEVAKLFSALPLDVSIHAFSSFPAKKQVYVFPYLDIQLQKKLLRAISKDRVTYILNKLSSDNIYDRSTAIKNPVWNRGFKDII